MNADIAEQRFIALDTVRGVAVMGILLLNIIGFSMPEAAYINPRAYGGATGADLWVYLVNFVLFDGKMRGLFSFLFGASLVLVTERAEAKGENPARVHYSRMLWLLVFGLAHLWLVWWGDILAHYALVGAIAFFFRDKPVASLVRIGIGLLVLETLLMCGIPMGVLALQQNWANASAAEMAKALVEFEKAFGVPPAAYIADQLALFRGSYEAILRDRFGHHVLSPLGMLSFSGPETLGYMLLGMASLKSGLLTGAWERKRYWKWMLVCFAIAIPAYVAIAAYMVRENFSVFATGLGVMTASVPFRPLMILAWACLILLLMRPGGALTTRIAAAGRMAFSNYLFTSLICTTLFYGYGLGLYGHLSRWQVYLVVLAIWALMLLWSKPWLERFRFGPLEWLWRSLARLRLQPIRGGAIG
ncbi:DUF418 domain-containing protein [Sphingomonas soli]|uniref:DUF418 domain-containing protein n=1 Tax=Sphingomonas soli TaxID=266127 RepID=UPI00082F9834|nr:DUF418 domain-containing protein [Sphingomonas soli]